MHDKSIGEAAYKAFQKFVGPTGATDFHYIPGQMQDAWQAAGEAAIALHEKSPLKDYPPKRAYSADSLPESMTRQVRDDSTNVKPSGDKPLQK